MGPLMRYTAILSFSILLFAAFAALPLNANGEEAGKTEKRIERLEKEIKKLQKENRKFKKDLKGAMHGEESEMKQLSENQRTLKELQEKTEELQKILEEVESVSIEAQESLVSQFVKISGYADAELRFTNNKNDNNSFRIRHLSLFFSKKVQEKWLFFSEIEFEDAPYIESMHTTDDADTVQGEILVEQAYIEYRPRLGLELSIGRFITPAGYWNIFHYYPYVPTQTRPIFVKKIFPSFSDGVQARSAFNLGNNMIDTHLYVSNGAGNPGRLDRNNEKAVGARINLSKDILDGMEAGFSYYRDIKSLLKIHPYFWSKPITNHHSHRIV